MPTLLQTNLSERPAQKILRKIFEDAVVPLSRTKSLYRYFQRSGGLSRKRA